MQPAWATWALTPKVAARAVIQLLREHISDGAVDDVLEHVDDEIKELIRIEST